MHAFDYDNKTPFWAIIDTSDGIDVIELSDWDTIEWSHFTTLKKDAAHEGEIQDFATDTEAYLFVQEHFNESEWSLHVKNALNTIKPKQNPPAGYHW